MEVDPSSWSLWTFWLHGFALWCAGGLVWFWFRFHRLEAAAHQGRPGSVERFNAALRGFPNAVYAKMLGKRPLRDDGA